MTSREKSIAKCERLKLIYDKASDVSQRDPNLFTLRQLNDLYINAKELIEKVPDKGLVLLIRYLNIIDCIKKSRKIKTRFPLPHPQIAEVKKLVDSITKRIQEESEAKEAGLGNDIDDDELKLPETPTDEPITANNIINTNTVAATSIDHDGFISCFDLYSLLSKGKFLIIDTRPSEDYKMSRIKTDKCINIPECDIKEGILASYYEKYFKNKSDESSLMLYEKRFNKYVDIIVLMDWSSNNSTLMEAKPLLTLKKTLLSWEKSKEKIGVPLILEGGFEQLCHTYPSLVTNPGVTNPNSGYNHLDDEDLLKTLDFPDIDSQINGTLIEKNDNIVNRNTKPKSFDSSNPYQLNNYDSKYNELIKNTRNGELINATNAINNLVINKKDYNINNYNNNNNNNNNSNNNINNHNNSIRNNYSIETRNPRIMPLIGKNGVNKIRNPQSNTPIVNRNSKPTNIPNKPDMTKVIDTLNNIIQSSTDLISFQNKTLRKERELSLLLDFPKNTEDISEKEDEIETSNMTISTMTMKLNELHQMYENLSEIKNQSYPYISTEITDKEMEIKSNESKLIKLMELRNEIKRSLEEKKNNIKKENNNIYKEPLKSEATSFNSNLKRSLSSPNLRKEGQVKKPKIDDQIPPIPDRSSKPSDHGKIEKNNNKLIAQNLLMDISPVYNSHNTPGITGLKNVGNSCYMNSIIQCLSNTRLLAEYFQDDLCLPHLNKNSDNETQGEVAKQFHQVIKNLWRGEFKYFTPRGLKYIVGHYRSEFDSYEQQDSHEFLTFLLEWMHNDLRQPMKIVSRDLPPNVKEWNKSLENYSSIISELFYGQLRSSVVCQTCNSRSTTYETFNCLSISLPDSNRCSLDDCLKNFLSGQNINGWACPTCKVPRDAIKKFDFVKLAPILVIHLNRFGGTDLGLEKKNTHVIFPLSNLNLNQYLIKNPNDDSDESYNYSLYALSNHHGTMGGGHYTAFCKNRNINSWYCYDDQKVTDIDESSVRSQNSTAYLLFYSI